MSWLKYQIDSEKEKKLLTFWKTDNYDTLQEVVDDPLEIFCFLFQLEKVQKECLSNILEVSQKLGYILTAMGTATVERMHIPTHHISNHALLPFFDDIGLIFMERDRSNLSSAGDTFRLSPFFEKFVKYLTWCIEDVPAKNNEIHTLEKKSLDATDPLLATYQQVQTAWFYTDSSNTKAIKRLIEKKHVVPVVAPGYRLAVYADVETSTEGKTDAIQGYQLAEAPPYALHKFEKAMWATHSRERKKENVESPELFVAPISEILSHPQKFNTYRKLGFHGRFRYLLTHHFPEVAEMLPFFSDIKNNKIEQSSFLRIINKKNWNTLKRSYNIDIIDTLSHLGLLIRDKGYYLINSEFASSMCRYFENKKVSAPATDRAIIDSDYHLTVYRQAVRPSDIHFLLSFCDVAPSEHLYQFKVVESRIPYAIFCGFSMRRFLVHLNNLAPTYMSTSLKEHIKHIYNQCSIWTLRRTFVFHTDSGAEFSRIKYALNNENRIKYFKVSVNERNKTFSFSTAKEMRAFLTYIKPIKFNFYKEMN